jgi:hypothetical protein
VTPAPFVTARVSAAHDRVTFIYGVEALDRYFRQQATRDVRSRIAFCFVMTEVATATVVGYFSVLLGQLPELVTARLPRYRWFRRR